MSYTPTNWEDNVTPVDAANLNKLEAGTRDAYTQAHGYINVKDVAYGAVGDGVADDTAALQAAANAAGAAGVGQGKVLFLPPGNYKTTSPILIPPGVSVIGAGVGSRLLPVGCDGLHLQGPWSTIGAYCIRDLYIAGTNCTNFAGIRVDGALVSGDSVSGYDISNVRIDSFGYGMYLRNLWRSSVRQVRMVNVYFGVYLHGQNLVLDFDGVVCDKGTPPGTPTGATNSAGFSCIQASDYNPGGNTIARPESIRVRSCQFVNFDIGVDHQHCLVADYEGLDLDYSALYGIRYNQSDGGLRFAGDWIAMTGTNAIAGIYAQDVGVGVSKSKVKIEGFHITSYTVSPGSVGIHLGDRQNDVSIEDCYVGPAEGGQDFQTADVQITGVVNGNTGIALKDLVLGSATPANGLVVGTTGAVTGYAKGVSATSEPLIGSASGTVFSWNGGDEVAFDEITAGINVTGTTPSAATTIIAGESHNYVGAPVMVEFSTPFVITPSVAGGSVDIGLFMDGVEVARIASIHTPAAANMRVPVCQRMRFTPSAGLHTLSVEAWTSSTTGTPNVGAGPGTGGGDMPAYLRVENV